MYAKPWMVVPPKMAAEDPVVDVKAKDVSLKRTPILAQNAWQ